MDEGDLAISKEVKENHSQHNHAKQQKAILAIDGAHVMLKILRLSLDYILVCTFCST